MHLSLAHIDSAAVVGTDVASAAGNDGSPAHRAHAFARIAAPATACSAAAVASDGGVVSAAAESAAANGLVWTFYSGIHRPHVLAHRRENMTKHKISFELPQ